MKRIITGAVALMLAISAFGCTKSPKKILSEAFETLNDAESMHMEMDVHVVAQIRTGSDTDADTDTAAILMRESMDCHKPTETMQIDVSAQYEGADQTDLTPVIQYRIFRDGDGRKSAMSYDGETWYSTSLSGLSGVAYQDPATQIDMFFARGDRFSPVGTEELDGAAVTVYAGAFDSKSMQEILGRYLSQSGVPLITFKDELWAELPDVNLRIAVDRAGYPVMIEIEAAAFMQKLFNHLLSGLQQDAEFTISELTFTFRYSGFNTVDEIPAPDNLQDDPGYFSGLTPSMLLP